MGKDFSHLFEIIYEKYSALAQKVGGTPSVLGFSRFMGFSNDGKPKAWKNGQWPSAEDCWNLSQKLNLNIEWILTGNDEFEQSVTHEQNGNTARLAEALARISQLEKEIAEERRLNRQLTIQMFVDGVGDKAGATGIGKTADGQK